MPAAWHATQKGPLPAAAADEVTKATAQLLVFSAETTEELAALVIGKHRGSGHRLRAHRIFSTEGRVTGR